MSSIHKGQRIASNFITGDTLPIGSQVPFGSLTIPDNWLLCDGRAVDTTCRAYNHIWVEAEE